MNGVMQYPALVSMTAWFDFCVRESLPELEPYFDVDGGRYFRTEDVEYIVYVEKPGPVEPTVEDHGYDVAWTIRTGRADWQHQRQHFYGRASDSSTDQRWHRAMTAGRPEMLKSYKFDSRDSDSA